MIFDWHNLRGKRYFAAILEPEVAMDGQGRVTEARFQQELLARLPLAEAVLMMFSHTLDGPFLDGLFAEHRGRCYEDQLTFAALTYLVRDALLVHGGSGRKSFERAAEAGELPVAIANAYGKLGRLPLPLSVAFLAGGTRRLTDLLPAGGAGLPPALPASLGGFHVVAIDGKKLKKAAKRLKVLRGLPGKMLGGKLLVAMSLRTGMAVAMSADPDGERNDVPLVPGLLPQVRERLREVILWIADRQFCDLNVPGLLEAGGDHFLVRYTKKLGFHADPQRPAREGADARGRRFVEEWGWVGGAKDKRRRYVRRVTLHRGAGEEDVSLVTDLLDGALYPAADLLEAYLRRWGIERMFQRVTEVFALRTLIGSTPEAMVFQGAFCLLLYNMVQVAKAHVASSAGREPEAVSTEKLFTDVTRQLVSWSELGDADHAVAALAAPRTPAAARARLAELLSAGVWTDRWLKAPAKKTPASPRPKATVGKGQGGHESVWRVLQAHRASQRDAKARAKAAAA
jgi:hypothetical protein